MKKQIHLFFNRTLKMLRCRLALRKATKAQILETLKRPDGEMLEMMWEAYLKGVRDLRELMVIVYDDYGEFPTPVRRKAGEAALAVIWDPSGGQLLPGRSWYCTSEGRLVYLMGVIICFQELALIARLIVAERFYLHEQMEFCRLNSQP